MSVLLLISKIIGVILLAVLGILLLLAILVLFVPVRYQINGMAEEQIKVEEQGYMAFTSSFLALFLRRGRIRPKSKNFGNSQKNKSQG